MAENTKIEWAHHTFNPWWGCSKISHGCANCYAEALDKRTGGAHWGPNADRRRTGADNWKLPLRWNCKAAAEGTRYRVFCASMADVFDDHPSILPEWRDDLWRLIEATPHLDWLLLTKRPANIMRMIPNRWRDRLPDHVAVGATVVNVGEYDRKIPELLEVPARLRFLSIEPLLASFNINSIYQGTEIIKPLAGVTWYPTPPDWPTQGLTARHSPKIHWVIVGGESGPGARPMHPDWVRLIRDQCAAAGVPFFFKQWGAWETVYDRDHDDPDWRRCPREHGDSARYLNLAGGTGFHGERVVFVRRRSKQSTGRLLDGITHDGLPDFQPVRPTNAAQVQA